MDESKCRKELIFKLKYSERGIDVTGVRSLSDFSPTLACSKTYESKLTRMELLAKSETNTVSEVRIQTDYK